MKEVVCTVLVAAYNAERYIGECLDSLVAQTQPGMEMIVIDDASEDGTADIVRSYVVRHSNISLITLSANSGQAHARNVGLRQAHGRYIGFLDADDRLSEDAIAEAVSVMERHDQTDCVLLDVVMLYSENVWKRLECLQFEVMDGYEAFVNSLTWKIHGVYIARAELYHHYPYDETARAYSDDNTTRLHYYISREVRMCRGVYYYRQHAESVTHKVDERHFDYLKANESMRRHLEALGVSEEVLSIYENVRWLVVVDCYWFYFRHRREMSRDARRYALAAMRRVWSGIEARRLYRRNHYKLGYMPLRPFWLLFRLQEEVYFGMKKALNR